MAYRYEQNIVLDLEFTPIPMDAALGELRYEVIEIGAVRTDGRGSVQDRFRALVHPERTESITRRVTQLTGISWWDVADQEPFEQRLAELCAWIGPAERSRIVAWSGTDRQQIELECAAKGIGMPRELARWLDLQKVYPRVMRVGRADRLMSLAHAVEWSGVQVDERLQHGALYDALCTAELLKMIKTDESAQQLKTYDEYMPARRGDTPETLTSNPMADALGELLQQMGEA